MTEAVPCLVLVHTHVHTHAHTQVAKFNGEAALQAKYCGACKEMAAFTKITKSETNAK